MTAPARPANDPFPGLTEEERGLLNRLGQGTEGLIQVLERLNGIAANLAEARLLTPALVDTFPLSRTEASPWPEGSPVPLLVDAQGRLRSSLPRRRIEPSIDLTIPAGDTVSNWVSLDESTFVHSLNLVLFDDLTRLAGELISVQISGSPRRPDPTPASPDARTITVNALGATIGLAVAVNSALTSAYWIRLLSGAAVGGDRHFTITGLAQ